MQRRKLNNIIIISCIVMISVLTLLNRKTNRLPDNVQPLFDRASPLQQLQLDNHWMSRVGAKWQCAEQVLNCPQWVDAWQGLKISPLVEAPEIFSQPHEVLIQIKKLSQPQVWQFFDKQGLLHSPAGNWYEIPPSLRNALLPIIDAGTDN